MGVKVIPVLGLQCTFFSFSLPSCHIIVEPDKSPRTFGIIAFLILTSIPTIYLFRKKRKEQYRKQLIAQGQLPNLQGPHLVKISNPRTFKAPQTLEFKRLPNYGERNCTNGVLMDQNVRASDYPPEPPKYEGEFIGSFLLE
jgi:hypothetical protein